MIKKYGLPKIGGLFLLACFGTALGVDRVIASGISLDSIKAEESLLKWTVYVNDGQDQKVFSTSEPTEFDTLLKDGFKFSDNKFYCYFELTQGARGDVVENINVDCRIDQSWVSTVVSCASPKKDENVKGSLLHETGVLEIGSHRGEYLEYPKKAKDHSVLIDCIRSKSPIAPRPERKTLRWYKAKDEEACGQSCFDDQTCAGWRFIMDDRNCVLLKR